MALLDRTGRAPHAARVKGGKESTVPKVAVKAEWSAKAVAAAASAMLGRRVTDKQVRGAARGDTRPPVISRVADDGYTAHAYTAAEYDRLMADFAQREAKRTGKAAPTWRHQSGAVKASTAARAVAPADRALGKRAVRVAPTAPTMPTTAPEAPDAA